MYPRIIRYQNNKSFFLFGPRGVGKTAWVRREFSAALYFDLLDDKDITVPIYLARSLMHTSSCVTGAGFVIALAQNPSSSMPVVPHSALAHS